MKKYLGIILGLCALILVCGSFFISKEDKKEPFNPQTSLMKTYIEKLNSSEPQLVYIWRPTCGYCMQLKPIMEEIKNEYNLDYLSIDTDELQQESASDFKYFLTSNEYLKNEQWGTPLFLVLKEGKVIDKSEGMKDKAALIEFFKKNNFIKG